MISARHAGMAEAVVRWLASFSGWIVRPEVSFSRYGERGVIDLLLWHPASRSVLVIELKTAIIDIGELLGTLDRKARNAWFIARELGWDPQSVSTLLLVADGATNRRRVTAHRAILGAALPDGIGVLRRWLAAPIGSVQALAFFAERHGGQVIQRYDLRQRVRPRRGAGDRASSRST